MIPPTVYFLKAIIEWLFIVEKTKNKFQPTEPSTVVGHGPTDAGDSGRSFRLNGGTPEDGRAREYERNRLVQRQLAMHR